MLFKYQGEWTHFQGQRTQGECVIRANGPDIDTQFLDSMLYEQAKFIIRTKYHAVQQKIKTKQWKKKKIHIKENNRYRQGHEQGYGV